MGRRPYEVFMLWFDADAIDVFGYFGENSSYDGVCMEGGDGGIDGHTNLSRDTLRTEILMLALREKGKSHLG